MSSKIDLMEGVSLWANANKMNIFRLHYSSDPLKGGGEKTFVPEINMWLSPWALIEYQKATDKSYYLQEYEIDFGATSGALIYSLQKEFTLEDEFVVPPNWTRYMALDPHPAKPHAALWLAVDPYDEMWVYREYWPSPLCFRYEGGVLKGSGASVTDKERAVSIEQYVECLKLLESKDNPQNGGKTERIYKRVLDYAARGFGQSDSRGQTDSNFQLEFEKAAEGINFDLTFEDAHKDRDVGIMALNNLLKPREVLDPRYGQVKRSRLRIMKERCPELIYQLEHNRRRKQSAQQLENEDPIIKAQKKRNDLTDCLVGETLVTTDHGDVPIRDVRVGMLALTRNGFRRVSDAWKVRDDAQVVSVEMSDGRLITGTPDHLVWTDNRGWIVLDCLRYGDILKTCQSKQSFTTEKPTVDTQILHTETIGSTSRVSILKSGEYGICTEIFGKRTTDQYPKDGTFITRTKILQTIIRAISLLSLAKITWRNTCNARIEKIKPATLLIGLRAARRWSGIPRKKEESGTANTALKFGNNVNLAKKCAITAEKPLPQRIAATPETHFAETTANLHGGESLVSITSIDRAQSAVRLLGSINTAHPKPARESAVVVVNRKPSDRAAVYDITVEGDHEFFANGVLVHNCARYLAISNPDYVEQIDPETESTWRPGKPGMGY